MAEPVVKPGVLKGIVETFRKAGSTAVSAATEFPAKVLKGAGGLGAAISKNKIGAFLLTGSAMIAAGVGIKSWAEHREQRKEQEALAAVPDALALKQNIEAKRLRLQEISADLGQNNRQSNFRETVRGGGVGNAQGQPDFNG